MPFRWSLNPYTGCPIAARSASSASRRGRPRPTTVRAVDPGEGQYRRGPRSELRAGAGADLWRSGPRPTLPAPEGVRDARGIGRLAEHGRPPPDHARPDDRSRHRRARRGCPPAGASITFSVPTLDPEVAAPSRHAPPARSLPRSWRPASTSASAWRRSCPISDSPDHDGRRRAAREAGRPGSGRTCCTCGPDREHFLENLAATGPTCSPTTSGCTPAAVPREARAGPVRRQVTNCATGTTCAIADGEARGGARSPMMAPPSSSCRSRPASRRKASRPAGGRLGAASRTASERAGHASSAHGPKGRSVRQASARSATGSTHRNVPLAPK